jgi:hypothetical protein
MAHVVAFASPVQDSVAELPSVIVAGVAVKAPIVGAGAVIVYVSAVVVPPAVATVTCLAPGAATVSMVKVAITEVSFTTLTSLTVTPVPLMATVVAPDTKFVPISVSATAVPLSAVAGLRAVRVGLGGMIVNVGASSVRLEPPIEVVSVTVRVPSGASAAMVTFAVADVLLATVISLIAMPSPLNASADVPCVVKFVPVSVTVAVVPRTTVSGAMAVMVGGAVGLVSSEHPATSRNVTPASARNQKPRGIRDDGCAIPEIDGAVISFD